MTLPLLPTQPAQKRGYVVRSKAGFYLNTKGRWTVLHFAHVFPTAYEASQAWADGDVYSLALAELEQGRTSA